MACVDFTKACAQAARARFGTKARGSVLRWVSGKRSEPADAQAGAYLRREGRRVSKETPLEYYCGKPRCRWRPMVIWTQVLACMETRQLLIENKQDSQIRSCGPKLELTIGEGVHLRAAYLMAVLRGWILVV
jgi:hypothetical protein